MLAFNGRSPRRAPRALMRALGALALWHGLAWAQQPGPAPKSEPPPVTLEDVVVTGSRIALPNLTSASAIQIVTAKEIQQGGKTDAIDFINQLPQNFQNTSADFSNTGSGLSTPGGITTADLRGLGPQRTLVLVNGRRLGTGDPNTANTNSAPDLDQIPVTLIERVDVVTGGASAVYGSDAIAGVVNFVLKHDFEGFKIDGQIGEFNHRNGNHYVQSLESTPNYGRVTGTSNDGRSHSLNVVVGVNIAEGQGNVTGYFGYLSAVPVASGDRDFGGCQLNLNRTLTGAVCHGSINSNWFAPLTGPNANNVYSVVGNQLQPWPVASSVPPAVFNSQKYIYMSRGDDRYTAGLLAHVDINEYAKPYLEFGFMTDKTDIKIAPSGLFQGNPIDPTGNGGFNINCSNPLLSAQQAAILCTPAQIAADARSPGSSLANSASLNIGRRNVEGGGRDSFWNHTNYRVVGGMTGTLGGAWTYDAYAQYYYTTLYNANGNYLNFQQIANALQVATDVSGQPVCVSGPPCVPWNIFKDGGVAKEQLAYLYTTGTSYGSVTERIIHADVTGDLGKYGLRVPLASNGIALNVGFEHRSESLTFAPDAAELSGLLSGFGGASVAIDNGYSLKESFIELRAPLVQDRAGFKDLAVGTGYRHSDYELAGGVNTYKFELQYSPTTDVRFRSSYQRAIRAPNVIELFTPQAFGLTSIVGVDPCSPTRDPTSGVLIPASASLTDCMKTGVTAAEYGNGGSTNTIRQCVALQCSALAGGNRALKPETASSVGFGATMTPQAIPGLNASIDYYRITLADTVSTIPATVILQNCLASGDPTYCRLINRTSGGSIAGSSIATGGYFVQTNLNVGAVKVDGIDLQASYKATLGPHWGSLAFNLAGAELLSSKATPLPGAHTYDCAGLYGQTCQTVNPRWRHNLRVTWNTPWDVEMSAFWRYIGSVKLDSNSADPTLTNGHFDTFDARLPAVSYLDLSATWNATRSLQVRGGINNVLDKDPPVVASEVLVAGAANSIPVYDQLGRQLFLSFTAKF